MGGALNFLGTTKVDLFNNCQVGLYLTGSVRELANFVKYKG